MTKYVIFEKPVAEQTITASSAKVAINRYNKKTGNTKDDIVAVPASSIRDGKSNISMDVN